MKTRESLCDRVNDRIIKRFKLPTDLVDGPFREDGSSRDDIDADLFAKSYLVASLLKKYQGGGRESDRVKTATAAWYAAENRCCETNLRLETIPSKMLPFIEKVQQKILDVIGSAPDFDQLDLLCRWGPGATFDIRRSQASVPLKQTHQVTVTKRALRHLLRVIDPVWGEALEQNGFRVVRGNRCVMVPKSSSTHRTIAAEPTGNGFLQAGVGRYFRMRLKLFGVDLDDQTINQMLCKFAVAFNLATIDLSMASDTLCRLLVDLLLPPKWTAYLEDLRSPYSFFQGKWVRLEKFSSMGNGFTFELETLIFWALCSVICDDGLVFAYGDDIIVSTTKADEVIDGLRYFGFSPNKEKSFSKGLFRESCGRHYFKGVDVTPVYQKKLVTDLFEMIRFHNRLFRWGRKHGPHLVKDACAMIIDESQRFCRRGLPRIPENFPGDEGFLTVGMVINESKRYLLYVEKVQLAPFRGNELGALSYKLRHQSRYSNACPRGHVKVPSTTKRAFVRRCLWASQAA